ncbi:hypothetical protein FRACYDRAFT_196360 [Fragilariopsis cylindrus CCMP1102]|uniref:Fe-S metabolism associated domain-containing protein n=1 Tax=Fragilariopsis cylindrus CCMP1102 TaxID=635003 RepID=A0A1E7ERR3_9STRA|nr:hypothetical protein FRACYDRAFT_196360 [Fragilariopsis cylindrus CCMP1102]|eukprot:OEU08474.1 hypothetical protein FRACYDRAFT_196360 [Fragilariopsis cylindrus CCMP1102]
MTPELKKVTNAFAIIQEEQTRYKQLLYMAQSTKEANNLPESSKIVENKVPGCLSTVYVDGSAIYNKDMDDYVINFLGDSDGLMTKGLVALLVRCLSGNTAKAIQNVDPQFIKIARIDQSLTPGRNNGFLNMLQSMKNKALSLDEAARRQEEEEGTAGGTSNNSTTEEGKSTSTPVDVNNNSKTNDSSSDDDDEEGGPKYKAIVQSLQALQPTSVQLDDNSDQYGDDCESHFGLYIVAPAFEGLNVIKRQQLIYMILGDLMPQIEALQITSFTPDEEAAQQSAS